MRWETVCMPNGSGITLSPDNYLNNNNENCYSSKHWDNCDNKDDITFTNKKNSVIESISMVQNWNGQWMTKNQVIMTSTISKNVIHKVTTQSASRR